MYNGTSRSHPFKAGGPVMTASGATSMWAQAIGGAPVAAALISRSGLVYFANDACWSDLLGVEAPEERLARDQEYCARLAEGSGIHAEWETIWDELSNRGTVDLTTEHWRIRFQLVSLPGAEAVLAWHEQISTVGSCEALLDGLRDIVFRLDGDGRILSISKSVEAVLGYRAGQLTGTLMTALIAEDHAGRVASRLQAFRRNEADPGCFEFEALHRDGQRMWLESNSRAVRREGGPLEIHGVARDVTSRKRIEEELRRSQTAKSLSLLAAGAAHNINNVITVINGYCERLLERLPATGPGREETAAILAAAESATSLTRQLIALSRGRVAAPQPSDLNRVIQDTVAAMAEASRGTRIEYRLAADAGVVAMDAVQVQQILLNLAINAHDAMEGAGTVVIATRRSEDEGMIELSVRDSGPGVPAELQDKIFEPFFTTKGAVRGIGLGLFTVRELVRQAGGRISVCRPSDGGTEFHILLPGGEVAQELSATPPAPHSETILVVEDDPALRQLMKETLDAAGYRVFAVANGEAALNAESACAGPLDLLVADVRLPGMSGLELAARVRARRPVISVLYVSGNPDDCELASRIWQHGEDFIGKPFRSPQLMAAAGRLLSGGARTAARILIADDHPEVADTLAGILEGCGHTVRRAGDGREVERILESESFDLLITDLAMPDKDGLEVIRGLRGKRNGMKLIAMSGLMNGVLLESALRLGADAVIDKPLSREPVVAAVRRVLRG